MQIFTRQIIKWEIVMFEINSLGEHTWYKCFSCIKIYTLLPSILKS